MEMMKAETETATDKSVRVQACAPLLCPLPREAEDDGSPGPGSESWPHCRGWDPNGLCWGKAHRPQVSEDGACGGACGYPGETLTLAP